MWLSDIISWLISAISTLGYFGIFILMALESSVVPVPAELVFIPAGYLVYQEKLSFPILALIAILGSLAGSLFSYFVALFLGRKGTEKLITKYEKVAFLHQSSLESSENFFKTHGHIAVFTSRFIPVIRHLISLPAGFSKMNLTKFSLYTILEAGIFNLFLIALGYFAGTNQAFVESNIKLITIIIVAVTVFGVIIYFWVNKHKKSKK